MKIFPISFICAFASLYLSSPSNACFQKDSQLTFSKLENVSSTTTDALNAELELIQDQFLEPNLKCGLSVSIDPSLDASELNPSERVRRIVGGREATVENSWPWIVAIYANDYPLANETNLHRTLWFKCAGTLINQRFVLTSAYCLQGFQPTQLFVLIGGNSLELNGMSDLKRVDKIKIHEWYAKEFRKNDIALIKLKHHVAFSPSINSICLPSSRDPALINNMNVVVVGW